MIQPRYLVEFYDNYINILSKGPGTTKTVSYDSFSRALSKSEITTPTLPKNTVFYAKDTKGIRIIKYVEFKDETFNMIHIGDGQNNVSLGLHIPYLFFDIIVVEHEKRMFIKQGGVNCYFAKSYDYDDTELWTPRIPNIYPNTGLICFGRNASPVSADIVDISKIDNIIFDYFIRAVFNNDLYEPRSGRRSIQDMHGLRFENSGDLIHNMTYKKMGLLKNIKNKRII